MAADLFNLNQQTCSLGILETNISQKKADQRSVFFLEVLHQPLDISRNRV
jgi:hypothetical protein